MNVLQKVGVVSSFRVESVWSCLFLAVTQSMVVSNDRLGDISVKLYHHTAIWTCVKSRCTIVYVYRAKIGLLNL